MAFLPLATSGVLGKRKREEEGEGEKERRLDFFVFASYHGVNAPIVSNFKLPRFNKQLANFWISNNWLLWACTRTPLLVTKRALANLLSHEAIEMREVVTRALVWPASALLHPRKFSCLHRYSLRGWWGRKAQWHQPADFQSEELKLLSLCPSVIVFLKAELVVILLFRITYWSRVCPQSLHL